LCGASRFNPTHGLSLSLVSSHAFLKACLNIALTWHTPPYQKKSLFNKENNVAS
jgi:hypothetical protein